MLLVMIEGLKGKGYVDLVVEVSVGIDSYVIDDYLEGFFVEKDQWEYCE